MTAHEILKLIETVDPTDSAALDEIDAKVHCFVTEQNFIEIKEQLLFDEMCQMVVTRIENGNTFMEMFKSYTRSRDALKAIRPKGYFSLAAPCLGNHSYNKGDSGFAGMCCNEAGKSFDTTLDGPMFPTEELAELHAILQAIDYERENK